MNLIALPASAITITENVTTKVPIMVTLPAALPATAKCTNKKRLNLQTELQGRVEAIFSFYTIVYEK